MNSRDAAVKKVEELELRLVDIASDGASATNTRPNTPSPVKGENDPAELVTVEETAEPASEVSEARLSINVVDVASHEREDHLLARAELAESAVAELRAKLESANVRVAAAEDEREAGGAWPSAGGAWPLQAFWERLLCAQLTGFAIVKPAPATCFCFFSQVHPRLCIGFPS